jgi:hypothetical protein
MGDLYHDDILEWSERQARLLRDVAAGWQGNPRKSQGDFAEAPDWANVIEEIESVGRSQLSALKSLLVQALLHDLKGAAWPLSRDVPHWQAEARGFRDEAAEAYAPSMRQHIDVAELYRKALRRMPESVDGQPPLPVPDVCPVTLDELLGTRP